MCSVVEAVLAAWEETVSMSFLMASREESLSASSLTVMKGVSSKALAVAVAISRVWKTVRVWSEATAAAAAAEPAERARTIKRASILALVWSMSLRTGWSFSRLASSASYFLTNSSLEATGSFWLALYRTATRSWERRMRAC